jgi:Na+-translocating ferredoxin:NAD+ oxidoreductase RNF subunit RnfB
MDLVNISMAIKATDILIPVAITGGMAILFGIILVVVAKFFEIPIDERQTQLREMLPGANCGACGYSSCDAYSAALANGGVPSGLCSVGGPELSVSLAAYLGVEAQSVDPRIACVMCNGDTESTRTRYEYQGIQDCVTASMMFSGPWACTFGCLGLGTCVKACPYDAIVVLKGVAVVDPDKCRSCELCVPSCPKNLIFMIPHREHSLQVRCRNAQSGAETRKLCTVGCIGCQRCVKVCGDDAIHMKGPLASIDQDKCTACGKCKEVCPTNSIHGG